MLVGAAVLPASPVFAQTPAAVVAGNWSISADGMYQSVPLPKSSLGWHSFIAAPFADSGPLQTFDPRLDGAAGRGAIGYFLPNSAYRLELGGSYVSASRTSSQARLSQPGDFWTSTLLDGSTQGGFVCSGAFHCTLRGVLRTSYESWQLFGKAAYDLKINGATVAPSVAVFGGSSRVSQALSQAFAHSTGITGAYSAATRLRWSDAGARAGVDVAIPTPVVPLTVALSGWVGVAARHVDLAGSDVSADLLSGTSASAVSISASRAVFLANVEGRVSYALARHVTVRVFGGANFDSRVPGIAAPSFASVTGSPIPAQISYSSEIGAYGGGGLSWLF